jgi:hypothetical protein
MLRLSPELRRRLRLLKRRLNIFDSSRPAEVDMSGGMARDAHAYEAEAKVEERR